MANAALDSVAVPPRPESQHVKRLIALLGNPNTGKSTLFNALTGLRQRVGNYPGVTVERHVGELTVGGETVTVLDLPGTYSLAAHSPDEMITVDALLGQVPGQQAPDLILVIQDASNLRRNLFLLSQVLALGVPVLVALNMTDRAATKGISIDVDELRRQLQVPVIPIVASKSEGIAALKEALHSALSNDHRSAVNLMPELATAAHKLAEQAAAKGTVLPAYVFERALIDRDGHAQRRIIERLGADWAGKLAAQREVLGAGQPLVARETQVRYKWSETIVTAAERRGEPKTTWSDRIDQVVNHPVLGTALFLFIMAMVFQSVFAWATPAVDLIDAGFARLSSALSVVLPEGALSSLLVDGVIAGVGSVVVFLPQIIILFAFIIFLEDTGYMARAAFLVDRLMRTCGLSGQSFIPMLSCFACAVPGIMGTRVIPDRRDRIATIMAAPFMTCSARLPVYALLIAAFVPNRQVLFGLLNVQGLVLLGLYLLGIVGGIFTAWLLKRSVLRGPTPPFIMELPPYHLPNLRSLLLRLWERARMFLVRAGTIIFTVAVIVWGLAYFPRSDAIENHYHDLKVGAEATLSEEALDRRLSELDNQQAAAMLEQSLLGRMGKAVAPLFTPLGWDWRISAAVIASFPAREVVIAVLGTIYSVGADVDETDVGLNDRIKKAHWQDGRPVFTLPVAIGLMIFYAYCLQCAATVAVIRRETNSYAWPIAGWAYMTALGYFGAFIAVYLGGIL
jgi:ferrous iron transport protein B